MTDKGVQSPGEQGQHMAQDQDQMIPFWGLSKRQHV